MEKTQERQAHRTRWLWLLLIGLVLLVGAPLGAFFLLYGQIRPVTVWELTGSCPPASALTRDGSEAAYAFDTGKIDWTKTGDAVVLVQGSGGPRIALVRLVDTTAPTARGVSRVLGVDEEPGPDAFITDLKDRQLVGVSFEQAPAFHTAGEYPVTVRLEDMSGNVSFVETSCAILGAVPRLDIEAGEDVPPLEAFLPNDTVAGRFVTDIETVDTSAPGVHTIEVEAEGQVYETALVVTDTVPPVCAFEEIAYAPTGRALDPKSLVVSARDASALSFSFAGTPDWNTQGYQPVTVAVTDAGGNRTSGTVTVLISDLKPLTWEASRRSVTGIAVAARQRELDESFGAEEVRLAPFVPRSLGCYDVNALVDGVPCIQRFFVVDTTAPQLAFPRKPSAYVDHPVAPRYLLLKAEDETPLTFSYVAEPDWAREGEQTVVVAAEDIAGNRTELSGTVSVVRDTEAPQILGVANAYAYIGEPVAYFATAAAQDNADEPEDVVITVDNSAVDIYTPGGYQVIYRATDRAGNVGEKRVMLYFIQPGVSEEKLQKKAEEILSKIVTDDMTMGQKAYAIYRYIYDHYSFSSSYTIRDWKYEAWRGLTYQRGGCFTYCAAAKVLLEKIGAKAMFVTRYNGFRHYWLMVDVGTGWYHFDPLNSGPSRKYQCFMLTTEQVLDLYPYFWRYDHRVYPETPTEPFVRDW